MSILNWATLDVMHESGWTKGTLVDYEGKHCLVGLVSAAHYHTMEGSDVADCCPDCLAALAAVVVVARAQFPERCPIGKYQDPAGVGISFNDHDQTTEADVEMVLHKAAIQSDEVLSN